MKLYKHINQIFYHYYPNKYQTSDNTGTESTMPTWFKPGDKVRDLVNGRIYTVKAGTEANQILTKNGKLINGQEYELLIK